MSEGHPCNQISDAVVYAALTGDPAGRVRLPENGGRLRPLRPPAPDAAPFFGTQTGHIQYFLARPPSVNVTA